MEKELIIGRDTKQLEKVKNCVFRIDNNNNIRGIGFFCHFCYKNEHFFVMVINYDIIDEEFIRKSQDIEISLKDDEEKINISLDDNRRIYSSSQYKTTIIEIKPKKDKIRHFLEIDENIYLEEN